MLGTVALLGVCALVLIAAEIGQRQARHTAWRRIAAARRSLYELERQLQEREAVQEARDLQLDTRQRQLQRREQELTVRQAEPGESPSRS